jgi:hypothetical protein
VPPPPPPPPPPEPDPLPPHATIPSNSASTQKTGAPNSRLRRGATMVIPIKIVAATAPLHNGEPRQGVVGINPAALRAAVVIAIVPIPGPLARAYELGFTLHVVACAGTVHDTVTVDVYPKNGVTPRSLMYCAVCPAVTVCDVIPRLMMLKSATRFSETAGEVDAV